MGHQRHAAFIPVKGIQSMDINKMKKSDYEQLGPIGRIAYEKARAASKYDPPTAQEVFNAVMSEVGVGGEAWAVGILYEMATSTKSGVIEEIPSQKQWIPISAMTILAREMARKIDIGRSRSEGERIRMAIGDIATAVREEHARSGGRLKTVVHDIFMAFDMPSLADARRIILDAIGMDQDRYDEIMIRIFSDQRKADEMADLKREKLESDARTDMEDAAAERSPW